MEFCHFSINITPDGKVDNLAGFFHREDQEIALGNARLDLNFLWIKFENTQIIFVVIDSLYFPLSLSREITSILVDKFNVEANDIIFSSTHTHSAPNISWEMQGEIDREYINFIIEKFLCRISHSLVFYDSDFEIEIVSNEKRLQNIIVNRRKVTRDIRSFFDKKALMLPNFSAEIDGRIKIIKLCSACKTKKVLVYGLSCHPVFNSSLSCSSDFIGDINNKIKKRNGYDAIFLQGFCGDLRPRIVNNKGITRNRSSIKTLVKYFLYREYFVTPDTSVFNKFSEEVYSMIDCGGAKLAPPSDVVHLVREFTFYSDSGGTKKTRNISFAKFGGLVSIAVPAEVLSKYLADLERSFPKIHFLPIGFTSDIIGYLPHPDDFQYSGYEVESYINYDWDTKISLECLREFQAFLINSVVELVNT